MLRQLVGDLNARVEVADPEHVVDVLSANVTARNLANVTALTNKRKLSERATDRRRVDALYADLKAGGNQAVADRFINVLLKLSEAPELLAVVADAGSEGLAPRDRAQAAAGQDISEEPGAAGVHHMLGERLARRGQGACSQPALV